MIAAGVVKLVEAARVAVLELVAAVRRQGVVDAAAEDIAALVEVRSPLR